MRIKHPSKKSDLSSVLKQLSEEYPDVPDDVTALILQAAARQDLPPGEDPATLLPKARIVLGESMLLAALHEDDTDKPTPKRQVTMAVG